MSKFWAFSNKPMTDEEVARNVNLYKLSNKTKSQKVRY